MLGEVALVPADVDVVALRPELRLPEDRGGRLPAGPDAPARALAVDSPDCDRLRAERGVERLDDSQWRTGSARVKRNEGGQGARSTAPPGPQSTTLSRSTVVSRIHMVTPSWPRRACAGPAGPAGSTPGPRPDRTPAAERESHEPVELGPPRASGARAARRAPCIGICSGDAGDQARADASSPPGGPGCRKPHVYAPGLQCSNVVPSGRHAGTGDGWRGHVRFQTTSSSRQMRGRCHGDGNGREGIRRPGYFEWRASRCESERGGPSASRSQFRATARIPAHGGLRARGNGSRFVRTDRRPPPAIVTGARRPRGTARPPSRTASSAAGTGRTPPGSGSSGRTGSSCRA